MKVNFCSNSNRKQKSSRSHNLDKLSWKLSVSSPSRTVAYINLISASEHLWSDCLGPKSLYIACGPHEPITKENYWPISEAITGTSQSRSWKGCPSQWECTQNQTWASTRLGSKVKPGILPRLMCPVWSASNCLFLPLAFFVSSSHSYSRPWSEALNRYAKHFLNVDNWNINVPPLWAINYFIAFPKHPLYI